MSWTLTTSGACITKAGLNANSAIIISGSALSRWSDEAEGAICSETRRDWVTDYASVKANFKPILSLACASYVANEIIKYDMSGYTSRQESQTMLDVNIDNYKRAIETLKDDKNKEKM